MPFTLSHAAAALPFRRFKPIWPALVIGTFAPDIQYFILLSDEDRSGHHFPGILLFTLPLALLLLWVFEWYVKGPVLELLPDTVQRRLHHKTEPLSFGGGRRFASIVLWIAVGIATHVFWDSFTHGHTRITAHWDLFSYRVPVPFHPPVSVHGLLQYASTVLGIVVLVGWLALWYWRTTPAPRVSVSLRQLSSSHKVGVVLTMVVIAVSAGYPLAIVSLSNHDLPIKMELLVATVFEAITLVFCAQVLIYGLLRTFTARFRRIPAAQLDSHGS